MTDPAADRPELFFEQRDAIAWITIDRPAVRNAMTRAMGARLGQLLEQARDDDAVSVVVITGVGTSFSAGLDRKEIARLPGPGKVVDLRAGGAAEEDRLEGGPLLG